MRTRHTLILAAAAGAAATVRGQEIIQVSYSWSETIAGTITPVPSPNSILEPGEGARMGINIFATVNGSSAIGHTTTYTPPPPPGVGTIRGLGSFNYRFSCAFGDATGTWNSRSINPLFNSGQFTGNIFNGGALVDEIAAGQLVPTGQTANSTNPVIDAFRGVWNPASYNARTINFKAEDQPHGAPPSPQTSVLVQWGSSYVDPTDPTTEYALYLVKYIPTSYGTGINIPISPIPAPPGLLILGVLATGRRRR